MQCVFLNFVKLTSRGDNMLNHTKFYRDNNRKRFIRSIPSDTVSKKKNTYNWFAIYDRANNYNA